MRRKVRIPIAIAIVTIAASAATVAVPSCGPTHEMTYYECLPAFTDAGVFPDVTCPAPDMNNHCPPGCELVPVA